MITSVFLKIKGLPRESKWLLMSANLPLSPLRKYRRCKLGMCVAAATT